MSQPISPNATTSRVFVLFDRIGGSYLRETPHGFGFAILNDPTRDVTEYTTEDEAVTAARRAGGDVRIYGLTKYIEP